MVEKKIPRDYFEMQDLGRATIQYAKEIVRPGMNLRIFRAKCENYLLEHGADSFWWRGVGAFVYAGDETAVSVVPDEGYQATDREIQENDIITIDLSPQRNLVWGDYARTIILQDGEVVEQLSEIRNLQWRQGLLMEAFLHGELLNIATEEMLFEELHGRMDALVEEKGYRNLDCLGNFGHSIETRDEDRIYIEPGNYAKLGSVKMFTFEPHIALPGSKYGYKKENIYYFKNNKLKIL